MPGGGKERQRTSGPVVVVKLVDPILTAGYPSAPRALQMPRYPKTQRKASVVIPLTVEFLICSASPESNMSGFVAIQSLFNTSSALDRMALSVAARPCRSCWRLATTSGGSSEAIVIALTLSEMFRCRRLGNATKLRGEGGSAATKCADGHKNLYGRATSEPGK